jgi:hypothetical protein
MVPQIKRNPVPPAAVEIPRPVSPIDVLTAQGTKTPTAAVKVLQPSLFDGKAPVDQQTECVSDLSHNGRLQLFAGPDSSHLSTKLLKYILYHLQFFAQRAKHP